MLRLARNVRVSTGALKLLALGSLNMRSHSSQHFSRSSLGTLRQPMRAELFTFGGGGGTGLGTGALRSFLTSIVSADASENRGVGGLSLGVLLAPAPRLAGARL